MQKNKIGLVGCVKLKTEFPAFPMNLYISPLFKKRRAYCEKVYGQWYIVSAKHIFLIPDEKVIKPYNITLNTMPIGEKRMWSVRLFNELKNRNLLSYILVFHTGREYYKYLLPLLDEYGAQYELPVTGLTLGQQLQWYNKQERILSGQTSLSNFI